MKHCCKNCHFLASGLKRVGTNPQSWNKEWRERLEPQEGKGNRSRSTSGCYKEIWFDSFLPNDENMRVLIKPFRNEVLRNRLESCFFVAYQEGMTFKAAEDLQRLEYEARNLKRNYCYTLIGLIIAGVGLVLSAIFEAANFFSK